MTISTPLKSKTLATWLALAAGSLGWHRLYLHGLRDPWAWLFPWPTLAGAYGMWRLQTLGQDDRLAGYLAPVLGLMLAQGMFMAIFYGLTADARWDARVNAGRASTASSWTVVLGVVLGLMLGAVALIASLAFSMERYVEAQSAPSAASATTGATP